MIKQNIQQLKEFLLTILPCGRPETFIFFACLLFYSSYSFLFLFCTTIIDMPGKILLDIYLNFDNTLIFHAGTLYYAGHPLFWLFGKVFLLIGDTLANGIGYKAKGVFAVLLFSSMISLSVLYIYRYLKNIIFLDKKYITLITLFYVFFSTNLILCFTTESFTVSLFLLSLSAYYYSSCVNNNKTVTFGVNALNSFLLGGITITNFAKGLVPMLFTKDKLKTTIIKGSLICLLFSLWILFLEIRIGAISQVFSVFTKFSDTSFYGGEIHKNIIDLFFGSPILYPSFTSMPDSPNVVLTYYDSWWQYLAIGCLYTLVLLSVIKNIKNRLVLLLCALFGIDILLHVVLKFGVGEAFIYGGHWVYVIPLFLGWLFKSLKGKQALYFYISLCLLFIIISINNIIWMIDFFKYMTLAFPVQ